MGFFGRFFGGSSGAAAPVEVGPDPIPVPIVHGDVEYIDHVALALDRICEQFRTKLTAR